MGSSAYVSIENLPSLGLGTPTVYTIRRRGRWFPRAGSECVERVGQAEAAVGAALCRRPPVALALGCSAGRPLPSGQLWAGTEAGPYEVGTRGATPATIGSVPAPVGAAPA